MIITDHSLVSLYRKNLKSLRKKDGSTHPFSRPNFTTKRGRLILSGVDDGTEIWSRKVERGRKCPCLLCVSWRLTAKWETWTMQIRVFQSNLISNATLGSGQSAWPTVNSRCRVMTIMEGFLKLFSTGDRIWPLGKVLDSSWADILKKKAVKKQFREVTFLHDLLQN